MDMIESLLHEIAQEAAKSIPEDVLADLEELARLQADVQRCMIKNKIIDLDTIKRINELVEKHYHRGEREKTMPPVKTFDFGEAIRRVKGGARVARKGWNGKGQYIQLACNISYMTKGGDIVNPIHTNIGNSAIAFVGTSGTQIGWLASQSDMLAEDWYELKGD